MIPTIGRTVIVRGIPSNGSDEHPAVITRAWGSRSTAEGAIAVNLTVFPDCAMPLLRSSVMLFDSRELASVYVGANPGQVVAFWPERVPAAANQVAVA